MSDWTANAFITGLKTSLAARAGILAFIPVVRIVNYDPSIDEPMTDVIVVGHTVSDVNEPAALGQNRYQETVDVECDIWIARPGAGDTPANDARVRAMDLLGEVDNQLRTAPPDVGDDTISARIATRAMLQRAHHSGETPVRLCLISFTIRYEARTRAAS